MRDWRQYAACAGEDTDLFFPLGAGAEFDAQIDEAKSICRRCPVREECLDSSLERPDRHGIFGGFTADERLKLRRREMRRARAA